ncbi:AAA family ATPase [Micromonospora sp. NPDC005806]|uniref:AAA family ATPase n=1 Tax=Micromonospora sp. NPDC005806 TaxID=3364234 RepID=UPI00369C5C4F
MLRLKALEITDFGPYRGSQTYEFSDKPGVELLWGENGRGKTSFLNALRYALFGVILGRGSAKIDLTTVGNSEAEGHRGARGFKTVLSFVYAGRSYKLTRAFKPYDPTRPAHTTADFREQLSLLRDGVALGPEERDQELARLLPEQIARFFLFDAELLQEYEQLLTTGSEVGERLKEAIERILGVPVLTEARAHAAALLKTARTDQAKAAQRDKSTRELGNHLQISSEQADQHRENVRDLTTKVEELTSSVSDLEKRLAAATRLRERLGKRNAKRDEVERLRQRHDELVNDLKAKSGTAWRAVIEPTAQKVLVQLDDEIDEITKRRNHAVLARASAENLAKLMSSGQCPTCGQGTAAIQTLEKQDEIAPSDDPAELDRMLVDLRNRQRALRRLKGEASLLAQLESQAEQTLVDLSDAEQQLNELETQLKEDGSGEAALMELVERHANTRISLGNTKAILAEERRLLASKEAAVARLSERLAKAGNNQTGPYDRKVALLTRLHDLLDTAVTDFRERLRERIEEDATAVFRVLSGEPDYDRLRINENYGLTILHKDGQPIVNRSSGYEHIVALSLIAALQRCSPMSGPIITDSPFGRLDRTHKRHVLKALPMLTDQVLLLVHDDELDRATALHELDHLLASEHHLRRRSARHTEIERGAQIS